MRKLFLVLLVFASAMPVLGQLPGKDSVSLKKVPLGNYRFYKGNERISMGQLTDMLRNNPRAFNNLQKPKTNNAIAFAASFVGGFMIGYELGNAASGKKMDGAILGAGVGAIGIAIPFSIAGNRNLKKAIRAYNAAFR